MKRKFAPVMITAAALITTVPTTQVFASEGINAETASDNITPLVINTENTQNTAQTSTEDTTQNAQEVNKQQTSQTEEVTPESDKEQKTTTEGITVSENSAATENTISHKADDSNTTSVQKQTEETVKPAVQSDQKLTTPNGITWDGKTLSWNASKGSSQLTLSDGTTFPVQIRYQITVKSTDGEDNIFAFTDTAGTSYDFSNELENDIPANEKFCFVVSAYYDSEDLPNASVDQMNEAYEVMENLAADEVTTDEYQNSSSSKPDTPKSEEVKTASVSGAVLTAVNGQNPSYIASTDTEGTEIVRESWICKDDGSVNNSDSSDKMKFEAGKTYTYSVTLVAKDGYHFGDSFTATVNGKNATVVHNTDGTITLTDISTVTVPSDPVAVKKIDTVKAANATLTCKAGEKPKFTATIPEGEERYEIVYESWSDGTTTIRSDSADSDFTFEAGKTYKYSIAFRLTEKGIADGYDLTGAKLTLNGKESGVSITESGKTAEYGNAVSVDVPRSDSKPDDSKTDDTKKDDTSKDDGKKEDSKTDDTSKDDSKKDDFSKEDTSKGDVKKDDSNLTDKKKDSTVTEKNTNQKDAQTSDKKDDQNSSNSGSGSNSVKTGDPAVWGLWASLFGSSGIAGAVIRRRKRK